MGQTELILIALFAVPAALIMALRANAAMVFLSLCAGYVLTQFLATDALAFTDTFAPQAHTSTDGVKIALLVAPALLTTIFRIKSMKGAKLALNLVPAAAVGCLFVLLVVPLLSSEFTSSLSSVAIWGQIVRMQDLLVGASVLVCLFMVWLQRRHKSHDAPEKKHA